jgi:hypothetical protein
MKLHLFVDGEPIQIEVERRGDSCRFHIAGPDGASRESQASVVEAEPGVYSVLKDGRSYQVLCCRLIPARLS